MTYARIPWISLLSPIVEFTGYVFYHKFCHSTGCTDQGTMAYGRARGEKLICLNLPFISADGQREQIDGRCIDATDSPTMEHRAHPQRVSARNTAN